MNVITVYITILISISITESYAKTAPNQSGNKNEVDTKKPNDPNLHDDSKENGNSQEETSTLITKSSLQTITTESTQTGTKSLVGRHYSKRCLLHPEKCQNRKKSERFQTRERKREEKKRLKVLRKKQRDRQRAVKMAWKEKQGQERQEREERQERRRIKKFQKEAKNENDREGERTNIDNEQYKKADGLVKQRKPSNGLSSKQNQDPKSNLTTMAAPVNSSNMTDSSKEKEQYYYDYEMEDSEESQESSKEGQVIEKRSQWQSIHRFRKACNTQSDCAADECCVTKANGSKVCSKKNTMREGRRCVDSCTCAGDLQCYRPTIRNARTGNLTPRRDHIGRCTTSQEVNVNDGVVLPKPADKEN